MKLGQNLLLQAQKLALGVRILKTQLAEKEKLIIQFKKIFPEK